MAESLYSYPTGTFQPSILPKDLSIKNTDWASSKWPSTPDYSPAEKKGWNFGDWSKKNPKTAGFLKGFMASRGMTGSGAGSGAGEGQDKDKKPDMFGFGSTTRQLAEGLTETRDPFYMHTTPGQYIPGKKGFGRVALDTGLGALTGFVTGGPTGAIGGSLGALSQNLDQF